MANKPNRSPESIEQRRTYARERSRKRYAEEKDKVLEEVRKYRQGQTFKEGEEKRKQYQAEYQRKFRKARKEWFRAYKTTLSCESCGFSHPAALDFHHIDPSQKETEVSKMVCELVSLDRVLAEISKCIVLCANCHRILHDEE